VHDVLLPALTNHADLCLPLSLLPPLLLFFARPVLHHESHQPEHHHQHPNQISTIAFCAAGGTVTASIYFPALDSLQAQLRASDSLLALTVSLFILGQGCFPVLWSAISEIKGRRVCYIAAIVRQRSLAPTLANLGDSQTIYIVATTVCSRANNIGLFIVMRVLQALGSGAVLALGSGTLADIYDVSFPSSSSARRLAHPSHQQAHERGTRLGIFYAIPLVGPALGPLIGGGLTSGGGENGWRLTMYFLIVVSATLPLGLEIRSRLTSTPCSTASSASAL